MPRAQSASLHETPRLVREMSEEAKPFLNDVQRQALDAALAAKLAKLSGEHCRLVVILAKLQDPARP